jgi:hypothetical protein
VTPPDFTLYTLQSPDASPLPVTNVAIQSFNQPVRIKELAMPGLQWQAHFDQSGIY